LVAVIYNFLFYFYEAGGVK